MRAPCLRLLVPRRSLLAVACVLLALFVAAQAYARPPDAGVLVPGESLGGITVGMSRGQVLKLWGGSFGRCSPCSRETLYFNRFAFRPEGAGVELLRGHVSAVFTVWAPAGWSTVDGLRIGEATSRAAATYPARRRVMCGGYVALVLPGMPRSVVYVVSGEVWGFALLGGATPVCR